MKQRIKLVCIVWLIMMPYIMKGQNLPQACGGSKVRYEVDEVQGSVFQWEITGGTLLKDNNNSVDIMWDSKEGIHSITVTQHNSIGCQANPVYGYVMVASPTLILGGNITICDGETDTLKAKTNYQSITWSNGSREPFILVNQQGYYKAEATFSDGCRAQDSIYLAVNPKPAFSLGRDTVVCDGQDITLDPRIVASNYLWSTGETTQTISLKANRDKIWVKITNNDGCSSVDTIQIEPCSVNQLKKLVPNGFTPNNDNDNRRTPPTQAVCTPFAARIYRRAGEHKSTGPEEGRCCTARHAPWDRGAPGLTRTSLSL